MSNGNQIGLNPQHRAQLPKTGHNLSHKFGFTAPPAYLLPVYHDILNPGETVNIGFNFDLRTMPLQQAAMTKLKVHTEYFFVPMQLLYEPFADTYYGINDKFSSNFANDVTSSRFPVVNMNGLLTAMRQARTTFDESIGESLGSMWVRMLDMFGFNPVAITGDTGANYNPNMFPWQMLAYQAVWQYYYRIDERERFNQRAFNFDRYYATQLIEDYDFLTRQLFHLHCRPFDDDYFTSAHVSPIVGPRNLRQASGSLDVVNGYLTRSSAGSSSILQSGTVGDSTYIVSSNTPFYPARSDISNNVMTQFGFSQEGVSNSVFNGVDIGTANIRAMFANEKLWSITGRAKKHYDDQTLAHFGFEVPHDVKHEITAFGHDYTEISIGEVISTASTEGAPLGEIAGKGYASQKSQKHKFTAPCHGVVLVLWSCVPERSYVGTYLKVNALTDANDLYKPEFDHLGQQPMFGYEFNPRDPNTTASIYGWQYRYEQYKRRYNRTTAAFSDFGLLNSWMLTYIPKKAMDGASVANDTSFNFVYYPTDLNNIMLAQYSMDFPIIEEGQELFYGLVYANDPFVVDSFVDCTKVSTMSDYSLPRLDA